MTDDKPTISRRSWRVGSWMKPPTARPGEPPHRAPWDTDRASVTVVWADEEYTTPVEAWDHDGCKALFVEDVTEGAR